MVRSARRFQTLPPMTVPMYPDDEGSDSDDEDHVAELPADRERRISNLHIMAGVVPSKTDVGPRQRRASALPTIEIILFPPDKKDTENEKDKDMITRKKNRRNTMPSPGSCTFGGSSCSDTKRSTEQVDGSESGVESNTQAAQKAGSECSFASSQGSEASADVSNTTPPKYVTPPDSRRGSQSTLTLATALQRLPEDAASNSRPNSATSNSRPNSAASNSRPCSVDVNGYQFPVPSRRSSLLALPPKSKERRKSAPDALKRRTSRSKTMPSSMLKGSPWLQLKTVKDDPEQELGSASPVQSGAAQAAGLALDIKEQAAQAADAALQIRSESKSNAAIAAGCSAGEGIVRIPSNQGFVNGVPGFLLCNRPIPARRATDPETTCNVASGSNRQGVEWGECKRSPSAELYQTCNSSDASDLESVATGSSRGNSHSPSPMGPNTPNFGGSSPMPLSPYGSMKDPIQTNSGSPNPPSMVGNANIREAAAGAPPEISSSWPPSGAPVFTQASYNEQPTSQDVCRSPSTSSNLSHHARERSRSSQGDDHSHFAGLDTAALRCSATPVSTNSSRCSSPDPVSPYHSDGGRQLRNRHASPQMVRHQKSFDSDAARTRKGVQRAPIKAMKQTVNNAFSSVMTAAVGLGSGSGNTTPTSARTPRQVTAPTSARGPGRPLMGGHKFAVDPMRFPSGGSNQPRMSPSPMCAEGSSRYGSKESSRIALSQSGAQALAARLDRRLMTASRSANNT